VLAEFAHVDVKHVVCFELQLVQFAVELREPQTFGTGLAVETEVVVLLLACVHMEQLARVGQLLFHSPLGPVCVDLDGLDVGVAHGLGRRLAFRVHDVVDGFDVGIL